jgi:predicted membrane protein
VAATLWDWCRWAADNTPAAGKSPQVTGLETIPDRLRRQGQIWRALLGGERKPTDVLLIGNYVDAAADILRKYWTLTSQVLAKSWPTAVFSVLVIALAVAVFFVVERFVGNTAAAVGAALGALGISWATIVAAVKGALNEVEKALWQTEITAAIGLAISHVPELPANSAVMGLRKDDPGLSGPAVEPVIKCGPDLSGRLRRAISRTMSPQPQPNSRS